MNPFRTLPLPSRLRPLAALLALGLAGPAFGQVPSATVALVHPHRVADLVLLDRGFDAGLRQGMVCRVTRAAEDIAEILVVDVRPACGAALIVRLAPRRALRAGDLATVKLVKT